MVVKTLKTPEKKVKEDNGNTQFTKMVYKRKVQVVANYQNDERKWLVVSAWVRGEEDPKPLWLQILLFPLRIFKRT